MSGERETTMITLKESVEKTKALLVEKLIEPDLRKLRLYLGRMISVIELCEALDQEIEDRRRRRESGVGPFYGEAQHLTIRTVEEYELTIDAIHAVEIFVGNTCVVKIWEQAGKVFPSKVVEGRIKYFGPERRGEERGKVHDIAYGTLGRKGGDS